MLKVIDNLSGKTAQKLLRFFGDSITGAYALFAALDFSIVDGMWVQMQGDDITALIVKREMSRVYVSANDESDYYELADFIAGLGGMVVHCPAQITARIGVTAFSKLTLMSLEAETEDGRSAYKVNGNLRPAFELLTQSKQAILKDGIEKKDLKKLTDRAYREWLDKTERGIKNGFTDVLAVNAGENSVLAVAVADKLGDFSFIREIATDADFGKMGYATDCVKGICSYLIKDNKTVFIVCDDIKTENFYKKIGFERKDYLELGIVEI